MKKTQVALAALALVASTAAVAEVKMSGIIDLGVGRYSNTNGGYFDQGAWSDHSSVTLSGGEDMGSGRKAFFNLEAGFTQNGNAGNGGNGGLFSRQSNVGLSSEAGTITLGQQLSPYILSHAVSQVNPGNFWVNRIIMGGGLNNAALNLSGNASAQQAGGFFIANAVTYTTPSISGWTGTGMVSTKSSAQDGTVNAITDSDRYTSLAVNGSFAGINITAANQDRKNLYSSWIIGGTYAIDDLTIAVNYNRHTDQGQQSVNSYLLGASYKLSGATTLVAGLARNNLNQAQGLTNVGVKYDLSKATFVYLTYVRATNGAISSLADRGNYATAGAANSNTVVGVSHSF